MVTALTWLSSAAEGPIAATLDRLGGAVGSMEFGIRQHFLGQPARAGSLKWFAMDRQDVARLRHPDAVLLGAFDSGLPTSFSGVSNLEERLGRTMPLIQIYSAWGDKPDERFPVRLAQAIWDIGSVPVITWEPWLSDFENGRHPELPLRDDRAIHGMSAVARGDYDFYIDAWAAEAARFGKPFFLRFAHEMNDPYRYPWGPQNNSKEEHIAAWRHVRSRFESAGARDVIWVWSPHVAYRYWETYYPGDDAVDWIATGALNFGDVGQQWSQWWSFQEIFGMKYPQLESFGKPVMIAEFGSLGVGGDREAWYRQALSDLPEKYPAVKALLFFHVSNDHTVTYQTLDWSVVKDKGLTQTIARAIAPWAGGP